MGIDECHTYFEKKPDYIRNNEIELKNSSKYRYPITIIPKPNIVPTPPHPNGGNESISTCFPVLSLFNIYN